MQIDDFFKRQKKQTIILFVLIIVAVILFVISLFIGQYEMSFCSTIKCLFGIEHGEKSEEILKIIINIRLPRTLSSVVIGGILAISGLTYQCVFRNNLVSQDILGVSTSACVGAALGIIMGLSVLYIQVLAFIAGMISIAFVFLLSSCIKVNKTLSLILSGILVGGVMSSCLALIKYLASPEKHLQAIVFWTMGDISSITLKQLSYIALPAIVCAVILFCKKWDLNYFCFNDSEARNIGFNIDKSRIIFIVCATVLVSSAVSISGSIGWIGLVIPQIARLTIGTNNKVALPFSFLAGSIFLLFVDIINRLISSAELPVSIISGILGLPVFIICLLFNSKLSQEKEND